MEKTPISQNFICPEMQVLNTSQDGTEIVLGKLAPKSKLYLLHQYWCPSSSDYKELIALLEAIQDFENSYLLNTVAYLPIKFTQTDGHTSHLVQVLYEFGSHTLEQELQLRVKEGNGFQEHQIWSIMGSCILALATLQECDLNHGSVCLRDIMVTVDGGVMLCHPMLRSHDMQSQGLQDREYQNMLMNGYFFSPEQLMQINNSNKCHQIQNLAVRQTQQDIYSLAMVILQICSFSAHKEPISPLSCYQLQPQNNFFQISTARLQEIFHSLADSYSQHLLQMLFGMLSYNPQGRTTLQELVRIIEQMTSNVNNQQSNSDRISFAQYQTQRCQESQFIMAIISDQQDRPNQAPQQCRVDYESCLMAQRSFSTQALQNYITQQDQPLKTSDSVVLMDLNDINHQGNHNNLSQKKKGKTVSQSTQKAEVEAKAECEYLCSQTLQQKKSAHYNKNNKEVNSQQGKKKKEGSFAKAIKENIIKQNVNPNSQSKDQVISVVKYQLRQTETNPNVNCNNLEMMKSISPVQEYKGKFSTQTNGEQYLYTDPALLKMIRQDMKLILKRKEQREKADFCLNQRTDQVKFSIPKMPKINFEYQSNLAPKTLR